MLRIFVIILVIILVPAGVYLAMQFGIPDELSFVEATSVAMTTAEGDMAPKVVVISTIQRVESDRLVCTDQNQNEFQVEYTGAAPEFGLAPSTRVKFVGHVHGGSVPYFHATQAYKP